MWIDLKNDALVFGIRQIGACLNPRDTSCAAR